MHRQHQTVIRPVWPLRVGHTGYTGMSDGVSRCGELFDLTDYTARAMWEVPLSQQQINDRRISRRQTNVNMMLK